MTCKQQNANPGHLRICQSSSGIPDVGESTAEKLFLEQLGSLCASLPLFLCYSVLEVNVSKSKRGVLIKEGARSHKKHALLHAPKEGFYLSSIFVALPGVAESGSKRAKAVMKCDSFFEIMSNLASF